MLKIFTTMALALASISSHAESLLLANRSQAYASDMSENAVYAADCDMGTAWNAEGYAQTAITLPLPEDDDVVAEIRLIPTQSPAGQTVHQIEVENLNGEWRHVATLDQYTEDKQLLTQKFSPPLQQVRSIRVRTDSSPSWVAWYEIQAYRSSKEAQQGCDAVITKPAPTVPPMPTTKAKLANTPASTSTAAPKKAAVAAESSGFEVTPGVGVVSANIRQSYLVTCTAGTDIGKRFVVKELTSGGFSSVSDSDVKTDIAAWAKQLCH